MLNTLVVAILLTYSQTGIYIKYTIEIYKQRQDENLMESATC